MAAIHRSSIQDQIADVTECSICTEIFTDPKVLPCVHTFCLHCLESYGKEKKQDDQMVCPLCRKEFHIPDGGFSNLPSNFFIGKMVEIVKLTMIQKNKELCALCPQDDEVLAQLFCVDCEQNLCSRCGNGHRKSRFSQHHQIVELGSQLNSPEINLRNSYCDHHPGEQIKMFCYEDNVAICLICCVESHQSHRCVNVNKAAGEFTQLLINCKRKVADRLPQCEEVATKLDKFKKEFEEEVFKTEEGIRDATTQLKKLIDQHTEILVQNLKSLREQNLKAFEITKQDVDRFKVMIDSFSRYSEELLARGSPVDVCRTVNQMLTRAHELEMLPANCGGDCFRCDSVSFHSSNTVDFLGEFGKTIAVGELTVAQSSHRLLKFRKETLAADVLISDETLAYKEKRLSITRHVEKVDKRKHIQKEQEEQPSSANRSIFVSQIPQKLNKEYLVMIFENKRIGGGKTENVDFDPEQSTAVITFEDPKVAASLIEKGAIEFRGQRMLITKHEDQTVNTGRGKDSDDNASAKQQPSPTSDVSGSFNTIKVSGISKDTSKDVITMYFESKRRSGGGKLTVLEYQKKKGKAVIMFKSPADGLEIFKRPHVLSGATLKITALEMPLDDVKSCAIEVKGLGERTTANFLELYFENTGRNGGGGGLVEKVFLNKEARSAIIVFDEATAVLGVMKKQPHVFLRDSLEVNVLEAAPPPPLLLRDVDAKRLLAKRLPPSTTRENLKEYLTPAAKTKMVGWTLAVKPSTALLEFSSEPDYLSIRRLVCSKPFLGKIISIRRVPLTSSILVTGIPSWMITADIVTTYFENPRNGGTGEECKVELLPDKGAAIVEFERPDVIHRFTSRRHQFYNHEVKVEPYYPWLV